MKRPNLFGILENVAFLVGIALILSGVCRISVSVCLILSGLVVLYLGLCISTAADKRKERDKHESE